MGNNPGRTRIDCAVKRLYSSENIDEVMIGARDRVLSLFDADKIIIYAVDANRNELYTRYLKGSEIRECRLAISSVSIAGYVACSKKSVTIKDAYDGNELKKIDEDLDFDMSWDERHDYRTRQVLAVPIIFQEELLGVIMIINKPGDAAFTGQEEARLKEIARQLGAIFKSSQKVLCPPRFRYLIDNGLISDEDMKKAIAEAKKQGAELESALMKEYKITKKQIGASLSHYYSCPFVEYSDTILVPVELVKGLSIPYLKKALWIPVALSGNKAAIAIDNPRDVKITEVFSLVKAGEFELRVCLKEDILKFIETLEKGHEQSRASMTEIVGELLTATDEDEEEDSGLDENVSIIVRLANQIILEGYEKKASDIHVEPDRANKTTEIRLRIDGICIKHLTIPYSYTSALVSRIKIMANLDISEKRIPQDGKIKFRHDNKTIELRVATVPSVSGEMVVMRILASSKPLPLDKINLSDWNYNNFKEIITRPYGIILVVGPTGSGKTTTLHSALANINTSERKIWTAEDPVEITQAGLCQVEVKSKINFTFATALRSFLRADPDVIMVGEMRDMETASIGVEASLTGHLVFSTLHTNSAPETVTRLIEIGIDPFNFADALLGILAQRLVRTLCKKCKKPYHPEPDEFNFLVKAYGGEELFSELNISYTSDLLLYRAEGCEHCNMTGYQGRTGIHELLIGTKEIKLAIQKRGTVDEIRSQAIKDGMRILHQDGIAKVFKGYTDYKQVRNVCAVQ